MCITMHGSENAKHRVYLAVKVTIFQVRHPVCVEYKVKCNIKYTCNTVIHNFILLDYIRPRSVKIGRGVRQGCCLSPILFNLYSEYLTKEALEGFWGFKIGGNVIHTVKYAEDLVLLAKEEKVPQDMIDKLIEIGRCYGMKMNVDKQNYWEFQDDHSQ